MKTNRESGYGAHISTISWFVTKGLRSRKTYIAMVVFITTITVTELSILIWLTSGITRLLVVFSTLILSVLAISEVIFNAVLQRAYRVNILMTFGAKKRLIAILLLTELTLGSLLGSVTGSTLGMILIFSFGLQAVDQTLNLVLLVLPFFAGLAIGVFACIYPLFKIMRLSITETY